MKFRDEDNNPRRNLTVIFGKHKQSVISQHEVTHEIDVARPHKQWDPSGGYKNDIAVVKLKTAVQFNNYIQPVALASKDIGNLVGHKSTLTGWGFTIYSGK